MSTGKNIDKICIAAIVIILIITLIFMNGSALGITKVAYALEYENSIFDTTYVHTIDITMDDWDAFIEGCEDEEYTNCDIVIDGEKYSNVAIRAKGNTSLSNVKSLGSQRYSFKLEFDHYQEGMSLDGLDKLCLNNLIQDNTMMKDYIVYQMMNDFGVDSPLCSYTYLTVNGEDWGLYLAVEGIEDSFLERNYNSTSGDLYKPDSMSFGGGRGNGKGFNMDDFDIGSFTDFSPAGHSQSGSGTDAKPDIPGMQSSQNGNASGSDFSMGEPSDGNASGSDATSSASMSIPQGDFQPGSSTDGRPEMPNGGDFDPSNLPEDFDPSNMPQGGGFQDGSNTDSRPEMPNGGDFDPSTMFGGGDSASATDSASGTDSGRNSKGGFGGGQGGGPSGNGSDDVKLKYIDDNVDSYSNIFDNAKTDVSTSDKNRLISSLKRLSSYTDLENTVNIDEVIRYFVVHNFSVNGDSYTGSMIHNYYLYEDDGIMSMIPWDYNLAFGTFQGNNASSSVNSSIDSPVSGGDSDDRPMVGWIFSSEEYTEAYHELFETFVSEWIDSGKLTSLISDTAEMISSYVEKDPTKFCTYDEFEKGVAALTDFVTLRGQAVKSQLNGDNTLVDCGDLNLSDMGTMSMGGGGNNSGRNDSGNSSATDTDLASKTDMSQATGTDENTNDGQQPGTITDGSDGEQQPGGMPGGTVNGQQSGDMPDDFDPSNLPDDFDPSNMPQGDQGSGNGGGQGGGFGGGSAPPDMPNGDSTSSGQGGFSGSGGQGGFGGEQASNQNAQSSSQNSQSV